MPNRSNTRYHNIEVLDELGFRQVLGSTIFRKKLNYILSPAVAENTTGRYWFDIRETNLEKLDDNALLLIRIVPDLFALFQIQELSDIFQQRFKDYGPHSGGVWRMHLKLNFIRDTVDIWTLKNKDHIKTAQLIKKPQIIEESKKALE